MTLKIKTVHKQWQPPEYKELTVGDHLETFDLIGGNPENGFSTKSAADKLAAEWRTYPKDAKARVFKIKDRWWVYGN
jgi:hypothetical protein